MSNAPSANRHGEAQVSYLYPSRHSLELLKGVALPENVADEEGKEAFVSALHALVCADSLKPATVPGARQACLAVHVAHDGDYRPERAEGLYSLPTRGGVEYWRYSLTLDGSGDRVILCDGTATQVPPLRVFLWESCGNWFR